MLSLFLVVWHSITAVNVVIVFSCVAQHDSRKCCHCFTFAISTWLCVQIGNLFGRKPTVVDSEPALTFDLDAMVEAVYAMGGDVVARVDVQTKLHQQ